MERKFNLDDYETVEDRITKFWEKFPDGRIETSLVLADEKQFIIRADVYRDSTLECLPFASGYAQEIIGQGMVNKTSALENGETSAIGRALANGGFATKGKRASRTEMEKVSRGNESVPKPAKSAKKAIDESTVQDEAIALAVAIGLSDDLDALRVMWTDNTHLLDVVVNDSTIRDLLIAKKDAIA